MFYFFLLISAPALVDYAHGYLTIEHGISVLSPAYRLSIIIVFLLRPIKTYVAQLLWLAAVFCLIQLLGATMGNTSYPADLTFETLKQLDIFFYLPVLSLLMSHPARENDRPITLIREAITWYGVVTSALIVLSLLFDIGYPSYYSPETGRAYGFGHGGYYLAGNTISISIGISALLCLASLHNDRSFWRTVQTLTCASGLIVLGTRTGLAVGTCLLVYTAVFSLFALRHSTAARALVLAMAVPSAIVFGQSILAETQQYQKSLDRINGLIQLSVRPNQTEAADQYFRAEGRDIRLVGEGYGAHIREFQNYLRKPNDDVAPVEKDHLDVLGSYGLVGLLVIFTPYAFLLLVAAKNLTDRLESYNLFTFVAVLFVLTHSLAAGHVVLESKVTQLIGALQALAILTARSQAGLRTRPGNTTHAAQESRCTTSIHDLSLQDNSRGST